MGFTDDWKRVNRGFRFSDWIGSFFGMESKGYTHEDGSVDKYDYKKNQYIHVDATGKETRRDQKKGFSLPWWAYVIMILSLILGVLYVFRRRS